MAKVQIKIQKARTFGNFLPINAAGSGFAPQADAYSMQIFGEQRIE